MTPDPMTTGEGGAPLGVRVAIGFLRVFCVIMYLPLLVSSLAAGMALIRVLFEVEGISVDFLVFAVPFVVFLILLITQLGCDWLAHHLRVTAAISEWARLQRPLHPVRHIFIPPLWCLMLYAFLSVVAWLPSIIQVSLSESWPWPVAWISLGVGAMYLLYLIDKKAP
jgi:hypothetical protein